MEVETHQGHGKCEWWGNKNILLNTRTNSSMLTSTSSVHEPAQTNRFTDTGVGGYERGVGQGEEKRKCREENNDANSRQNNSVLTVTDRSSSNERC